jgi:hypothetical protein
MKASSQIFSLLPGVGVLCCLLMALPVQADSSAGVINVVGLSERLVRPDLAHLEISVDVREEKIDDARREVGVRTSGVLRSLKEIGIPEDAIDSGSVVVQPEFVWDPKSGARRQQGYQVARTIRLRLRDLEKLGLILERTLKSGANQVAPPRFALQSESQLRRELLTEATRDARQNAVAIAAGLEAKLGAALRVDAIEVDTPVMPSSVMLRASAASAEDAAAEQSYRPGDMTLRVRVKASFAIAP